ncbi:hypothetical protein SBF1_3770002 [Candidatus Desulfosporosinus infrequens]|uniref:Uncharacterized protein n=1 Tax=Candidatus Desulfosporosinus infrequens TaxID=2043169 RepID=A0A2U3L556_9FIRM|nr:hypothetical protein SBF1_3770002 [Candidatus Desulfosporosinus infrequens]
MELTHELFKYNPGDKVTITIFRRNKTMDVVVTLVESIHLTIFLIQT